MAGLFGDDDPAPPPASAGAPLFGEAPAPGDNAAAYRVLARKYRPRRFDDLIGQDALVRTLRNAFKMNRLAHAFMLTGVRGVGKTTTARILARAVNCTGPDGGGGPTPDPCGVCDNCVAILADRHPDVLEMDAASNTGVDDVREIIEATRFRPLIARTKFFIIDEVHMLSRQAFNALLKTLEEPPPHIKFVLATTEIRKVPVTVLSRCQRFDLRRVAVSELTAHFARIAAAEQIAVAPAALDLIARAADGSVRDGLSLLDQAIARGAEEGDEISGALVADMLGLADRGHVFDLMDAIVAGDAAAALAITEAAHERGGDAGVLLGDLLGLAHLLTRLKAAPALAEGQALPEAERVRGVALARNLSVPWLGRMWQMLLKGVAEVEAAPDRRAAAEMICIRLCHVADMPPPGELVKRLSTGNTSAPPPPPGGGVRAVANGAPVAAAVPATSSPAAEPQNFIEVVELAHGRREVMLYAQLRHYAHPVRFAPPVSELRLQPDAPRDLARRLAALLETETGRRWTIALVNAPGEPTLEEAERSAEAAARADAAAHPLVQDILRMFPGARLETNGVIAQPALPVSREAPLDLPPALPIDWDDAPPPEDALIPEED
jgi:DNA polymerase-3 subunit gamma/tau